jgi:hypothetical protein
MQYPGVLVMDLTSPANMSTSVDGVKRIDVLFGVSRVETVRWQLRKYHDKDKFSSMAQFLIFVFKMSDQRCEILL